MHAADSQGVLCVSPQLNLHFTQQTNVQMPHVRASEYKLPSSDHELVYVEVIHRHHKRTPYPTNTFYKEVDSVSTTC